MNHKRRRPKNRRAGCLLCKPWKANGAHEDRPSIQRKLQDRWDEDDYRCNKDRRVDGG